MNRYTVWETRKLYLWMMHPHSAKEHVILPNAGFTQLLIKTQERERSHAILIGLMPESQPLELTDKSTVFELHHVECGNPEDYVKGAAVLSVSNCAVLTLELENLSREMDRYPDDRLIYIALEIECDIKILKGESTNAICSDQ